MKLSEDIRNLIPKIESTSRIWRNAMKRGEWMCETTSFGERYGKVMKGVVFQRCLGTSPDIHARTLGHFRCTTVSVPKESSLSLQMPSRRFTQRELLYTFKPSSAAMQTYFTHRNNTITQQLLACRHEIKIRHLFKGG